MRHKKTSTIVEVFGEQRSTFFELIPSRFKAHYCPRSLNTYQIVW